MLDKYLDPKKLWIMKISVIPTIVGLFGMFSNDLENRLCFIPKSRLYHYTNISELVVVEEYKEIGIKSMVHEKVSNGLTAWLRSVVLSPMSCGWYLSSSQPI